MSGEPLNTNTKTKIQKDTNIKMTNLCRPAPNTDLAKPLHTNTKIQKDTNMK